MMKNSGVSNITTEQPDIAKIYVGCSLTHASQNFKDSVEELKKALRQKFEVLDFVGLVDGTAKDVYEWDIHHCVATCDFFLAICDYASLGLGYEMGVAVEKYNKPILAVAHKDTHLSRLVLGIDAPSFYSNALQ